MKAQVTRKVITYLKLMKNLSLNFSP